MLLRRPGSQPASGTGSRSTCCGARPRWRSPRARTSSPAARSTCGTPTRKWPGPGPRSAHWGQAFGRSAGAGPGRWSAPRSGRRSRSPACCWPGGRRRQRRRRHHGDDWEADRRRCSTGRCRSPSCSARRGLILRSDLLRPWSSGSRPRSSRGASTPGSSPPRCRPASGPGTSGARRPPFGGSSRRRRSTLGRAGEIEMLAADRDDPRRAGRVPGRRRVAGRAARGRGRCSPRSSVVEGATLAQVSLASREYPL